MPKGWSSLKSDEDIDKDMVTDSRPKVKSFRQINFGHDFILNNYFQIRLQIKRNVARVNNKAEFSDRDVDDAPDGYVACESYKDTHTWEHVANMERAMQVF